MKNNRSVAEQSLSAESQQGFLNPLSLRIDAKAQERSQLDAISWKQPVP
jgi:hypothetical protein